MNEKPRYRVPRAILQKGMRAEAQEHPGFSQRTHRKIARQHIERYGPGYYVAEKVTDRVVQNVNKKMGVKPIRRVRKT